MHTNTILSLSVFFGALFFCTHLFSSENKSPPCKILSSSELESFFAKEKLSSSYPNGMRLIFFAPWCSSCKDNLIKMRKDPSTIFLGIFDEIPRLQKLAAKVGFQKCIIDKDGSIADHYSIKSLPYELIVK